MEVNTNRMVSLNVTNYRAWKSKMKNLMYVKEYRKSVFFTVMLEDMKEYHWEVLHLQACGFIRQWVYANVLNHISDETHFMIEIGGVVCSQRRYQQDVLDQEIDAFEVQGGHFNYRSCE
jgi:hypothetical protein